MEHVILLGLLPGLLGLLPGRHRRVENFTRRGFRSLQTSELFERPLDVGLYELEDADTSYVAQLITYGPHAFQGKQP